MSATTMRDPQRRLDRRRRRPAARRRFGFEADARLGRHHGHGLRHLNGTADTPLPHPVAVPTISIDDASITEGDSGTSQLAFTVKLLAAAQPGR